LVVLVHCVVDSGEDVGLYDLDGCLDGGLEDGLFVGCEVAEDVIGLCSVGVVVSDAHSESRVVVSDELLYVSESVVSAVVSAGFESEGSEG